MSDPTSAVPPAATSAAHSADVPAAPAKPKRPPFQFTGVGCRTDVRVGSLLVLIAVFLWLWFGPQTSARIFLAGVPFLLWGVPWQAIQARRDGRPGFPWKLGIAMTVLGVAQWCDLRYREWPGGEIGVQVIAPMLTACGVWILLWWPIARQRAPTAATA